ncbi:MAG: hypothetical protein IT340_13925, partial [Chloroflexi bacterium]|nr:hypothetical protein [Chloroflexota bacterium]
GAGGAAAAVGPDAQAGLAALTVGFQEPAILEGVNAEHRALLATGFFGRETPPSAGSANPQALNRYAYVLNNPVRYTDPTGHDTCAGVGCGGVVRNESGKPQKVLGSMRVSKEKCESATGQECTREFCDGKTGVRKCNITASGEIFLEGFEVTLLNGESSTDYNMGDIDWIVTGETESHYLTSKVSENEIAVIRSDDIHFYAKSGIPMQPQAMQLVKLYLCQRDAARGEPCHQRPKSGYEVGPLPPGART